MSAASEFMVWAFPVAGLLVWFLVRRDITLNDNRHKEHAAAIRDLDDDLTASLAALDRRLTEFKDVVQSKNSDQDTSIEVQRTHVGMLLSQVADLQRLGGRVEKDNETLRERLNGVAAEHKRRLDELERK